MRIVIPSRGRAGSVRTLDFVENRADVTLVVPGDEFCDYADRNPGADVIGVQCANIMEKRQWILDKWAREERIVMMDDDLRFRTRRPSGKFEGASKKDITRMLFKLNEMLDDHVHGGVADEFMSQHNPPGHVTRRRYNQVLAYNFVGMSPSDIPRYRLTINEEHDMHLQLLAQKHVGFVLTDYTKGSKYNAIGGCSVWRTPELEVAQFREFEALWPGIVQVVPVKNSISGVGTRVAWRRA